MVQLTEGRRIGHLLRRAGFGASADELITYASLGFDAVVRRLVDYDRVPNDALDERVKTLEAELDLARLPPIQTIWLTRMLHTARPLEEKMTLFWHDHFATANSKVARPQAMYDQNKLLRSHALGNFRELLNGIARDPAMLRWLDSNSNRRQSPNENFARELMELFTMGVGNYTETDVREAARAFTGWFFVRDSGFVFNRNQHDFGEKTFLGRRGTWDGGDIIDIILEQPGTAEFVARKLFVFLVHDHPGPSTVSRLADGFRRTDYNVRELVRSILTSPEFSSTEAYHATVRSPAEWLVGSMKALAVAELPPNAPGGLRRMGMDLFNPPDVNGWTWGSGWIGSATLLERFNSAMGLTSQRGANARYGMDPTVVLRQIGGSNTVQIVDGLIDLLIEGDAPNGLREAVVALASQGSTGAPGVRGKDPNTDRVLRGAAHLIMCTPVYQMA